MKYLVVGDIHGCREELDDLLQRVGLSAGDQIIAVGDLVDRGPDPVGTLAFFRQAPNARSILGNHERLHVRGLAGHGRLAPSQRITRAQIGEAGYPEVVAFMRGLPLYLDLPDARIAHGFWEPGRPIEQQREQVLVGTPGAEAYLRLRVGWPWYEHYDGDRPLIVGHRDYTGRREVLIHRERVYGIDTRCCYGGSLTGLLLPDFRLFSVPGRGDRWAVLQRQYAAVLAGDESQDAS